MTLLSREYKFTLCSGSKGALSEQTSEIGVKFIFISGLAGNFSPSSLITLYRVIRREKPDLVHTHSAVASFVGRFAGRLTGVKVLYTVHGWHFVPNSAWRRRLLGRILELIVRPFTSAWITVSDYDYRLGVQSGVIDRKRSYIIPNGVENVSKNKNMKARESLRMVFVGRATYQKNCIEAIDIFELIDESVVLTMYVTGGDHLPELKDRIKSSGVADRISLIEDDPNASNAMHHYDVLLLTSRYEGMPLCVLEAMRDGLVVVATDVCGMNEVIVHQETGFLYQLGDAKEAAKWIDRLLDFDVQQKMSQAARVKFEVNHLAEKMAMRTAEIYDKLLDDK